MNQKYKVKWLSWLSSTGLHCFITIIVIEDEGRNASVVHRVFRLRYLELDFGIQDGGVA